MVLIASKKGNLQKDLWFPVIWRIKSYFLNIFSTGCCENREYYLDGKKSTLL
jgi:hypothetical protein